jgi:hypothetical protein
MRTNPRTTTRTTTVSLLAPIALLALGAGCVHIAADVDSDQQVSVDLPDFGTECAGAGMSQTASGVAMWTKTVVGERCQIDSSWAGTLIDMVAVRAKADEKGQGATLTLKSVDLGFDNVALRDQAGNDITPPRVPAWEAHLKVGDQPVADFSGDDLGSLLAAPQTFTAPPAVLDQAEQAFAAPAPLGGQATARLLVEMADLPTLGAALGPHLEFHFVAHIEADAKKDLL